MVDAEALRSGAVLDELPPIAIEGHRPTSVGNEAHPMRLMTRRAAGLQPPPWDEQARRDVAAYFDELAPEWHTRTSPGRDAVVADVLVRGVPDDHPGGVCVELGSGIGAYTPLLAERWATVLAVEVAEEMVRLAPPAPGHRVIADGVTLPLAAASADAVVLVNCFLFPAEVDRVLSPEGVLVWVNSSGDETPIHLPPADVAMALPGDWTGVHSRAGAGLWAVLWRAGSPAGPGA